MNLCTAKMLFYPGLQTIVSKLSIKAVSRLTVSSNLILTVASDWLTNPTFGDFK